VSRRGGRNTASARAAAARTARTSVRAGIARRARGAATIARRSARGRCSAFGGAGFRRPSLRCDGRTRVRHPAVVGRRGKDRQHARNGRRIAGSAGDMDVERIGVVRSNRPFLACLEVHRTVALQIAPVTSHLLGRLAVERPENRQRTEKRQHVGRRRVRDRRHAEAHLRGRDGRPARRERACRRGQCGHGTAREVEHPYGRAGVRSGIRSTAVDATRSCDIYVVVLARREWRRRLQETDRAALSARVHAARIVHNRGRYGFSVLSAHDLG